MERTYPSRYITYALVTSLIVLLCGCMGKSQPARFYALTPINMQDNMREEASLERPTIIGLRTVDIPDYLDRPQMVTRNSQNELDVAEYDRWAGSISNEIKTVLAENLSMLLSQDQVTVMSADWNIPVDYWLAVDIRRFDVMPDGKLLLKAEWTLASRDGKTVNLLRNVRFSEPVNGIEYPAKVAAMSRAMERLSREIADPVRYEIQKEKSAAH